MQPKNFTIKPNGFKEVRKRVLIRTIPILLIALSTGLSISYYNQSKKDGDSTVLYIVIPLLLVYGCISISRSLKKRKQIFESFTLTIDANSIWRDLKDTPSIHIFLTEIEQIHILPNRDLVIKTKEKANLIWVPSQVQDFEELKAMLSEIKPLEENDSIIKKQKWAWALAFASMALLAFVFISTNKIIVILCGIALIGYSIYVIEKARKSKHIDHKTKRGMLWYVVLMVAVIMKIAYVLVG